MAFLKDTVKGITWVGAARGVTRVISFGKTAVIARVLLPAQFGLYGITGLVLAFLEILTETGINVFLIQRDDNIDDYIDTAWVVSIGRGLVIAAVFYFTAQFVATFFHSEAVLPLLQLMAFVPLIRGFINPTVVRFQKDLRFNQYFSFNSTIFLFDALVAVGLLVVTHQVSSLIWGNIAAALLEVALSFAILHPRPKFIFDKSKLMHLFSRGKWVTASGTFQYAFRQGDDIVVGRLLSEGPLGIYQAAYKLSSLPISEITDVVGRVTLPVYAKMSGNMRAIKSAYFKTLGATAVLVIPAGVGIYLFADPIVRIVLGPNWLEAIPILRILAGFGVIQALVNTVYSLFFALKKQEYVTAITFVQMVGLGVVIVPFVHMYGIAGAGYSAIVGSIAIIPVATYFLYKTFGAHKV